ncbi:hypothetical protein IMSHALPRED_004932 [Imshaugia aleurites]|uniref:Uncharacterized protein n=1 Tax=Imshaugia aleurites TaxID=172621 RepID=A0A8H3IM97_9LECA|nr:hypothetical protein IMSHALPRED_004932 [Imshaugia aleurites]
MVPPPDPSLEEWHALAPHNNLVPSVQRHNEPLRSDQLGLLESSQFSYEFEKRNNFTPIGTQPLPGEGQALIGLGRPVPHDAPESSSQERHVPAPIRKHAPRKLQSWFDKMRGRALTRPNGPTPRDIPGSSAGEHHVFSSSRRAAPQNILASPFGERHAFTRPSHPAPRDMSGPSAQGRHVSTPMVEEVSLNIPRSFVESLPASPQTTEPARLDTSGSSV